MTTANSALAAAAPLDERTDETLPTAPRRRFALGRVVKNAAPDEDVVAQIRAAKAAGREPKNLPQVEAENIPAPLAAAGVLTGEDRIEEIAQGLDQMFDLMVSLHEQEKTRDKMFDALYDELHGYKNDFFYERLKPVLQPLLFLLDSVEQYQHEISGNTDLQNLGVGGNVAHFHDQLMEALHIAQMEPMPQPEGEFSPKTQRAVQVVEVAPAQHNQVLRVVRGGWLLNKQPIRPADVVVGRSKF